MAVILKKANFRHNDEGTRMVEVTLYADSLTGLPTDASEIEGLLADDELDAGSITVDMSSGSVAMYDGTSWNNW